MRIKEQLERTGKGEVRRFVCVKSESTPNKEENVGSIEVVQARPITQKRRQRKTRGERDSG